MLRFCSVNASMLLLLMSISCSKSLPKEVELAYESLPEYVDYNFHIKPILSDRCYNCHGPDAQTRKAGLRLDIEEEAFKKLESGNHAFVKGSINNSEVIQRLLSNDPDLMMPPPESELTVSDREIALIAKWLDQGSKWKEHWSFLPIEKKQVPDIKNNWTRNNEIDNYIQDNLLQVGLEPSLEANKEHLIKRVTMDLTGLPPSLEEIDEFINDNSENAYEKVVDRLLLSNAHAERMTQEWMDVARYSDSHGISFDGYRTSWPYRDWLIQAFQQNMPYDEFVTHQIAGDLIEQTNDQSKIATAFLRMNPLEASGGSIPEEFRIEYVNERAGLTGTALLGLTLECAKCHDHKFDPISQKEFYQVSAFFNTTEEYGLAPVDADRAPTLIVLNDKEKSKIDSMIQSLLAEEKSIQKIKKVNQASTEYQQALPLTPVTGQIKHYAFNTIKPYKKEIKKKKKKEDKKKKDKEKKEVKKEKKVFVEMQMLDNDKEAEANLKITLTDGKYGQAAYFNEEYDIVTLRKTGEFDQADPFSVSTWISTEKDSAGSSQTIIGNTGTVFQYHRGWELVLDSTNHVRVRLIHRLPDEFISVSTSVPITANQWQQIGFTYDGSMSAKGISLFVNGIKTDTKVHHDHLERTIVPINNEMKRDTIPLVVGRSNRLWMEDLGLFRGAIDEIKIYDRQLSQWEMASLGEATLDQNSTEIKQDHWYLYDKNLTAERKKLRETRVEIGMVLDSANEVMVMEEMKIPRKTYILEKGLYNQLGEEVAPGGVDKVLPFSNDLAKNRLGLAEWLFDPNNPIVARVAINRYWQMIFGLGLVKTAEDFGSQGSRPSHPELLDWLAKDFIDHNWDTRYAIKQMVMSHTYRQASYCPEEIREMDPENIYLARSPSYRWPAEMIRDNALKASGLLAEEIGGPSVKPYQPDGLWKEVLMASSKLAKYKPDTGDNLYRRSLYTFSRRFAPNPFMINFDATPREICTIRRNVTSTPLQALTLLNDPQFVEASRVLSEKVQKEYPDSVSQQIELAFRRSTGLKPNEDQVDILNTHYQESLKQFMDTPQMADSILSVGEKPFDLTLSKEKTAAMTIVVSTIFNFDESYMKR